MHSRQRLRCSKTILIISENRFFHFKESNCFGPSLNCIAPHVSRYISYGEKKHYWVSTSIRVCVYISTVPNVVSSAVRLSWCWAWCLPSPPSPSCLTCGLLNGSRCGFPSRWAPSSYVAPVLATCPAVLFFHQFLPPGDCAVPSRWRRLADDGAGLAGGVALLQHGQDKWVGTGKISGKKKKEQMWNDGQPPSRILDWRKASSLLDGCSDWDRVLGIKLSFHFSHRMTACVNEICVCVRVCV